MYNKYNKNKNKNFKKELYENIIKHLLIYKTKGKILYILTINENIILNKNIKIIDYV